MKKESTLPKLGFENERPETRRTLLWHLSFLF
jgi:hypothetical protein